jgi:hypothetical protein
VHVKRKPAKFPEKKGCYDKIVLRIFFYCFTAHSLCSLEPQRTQSFSILLFSVDPAFSGTGTPENNKKHALRTFKYPQYRAAIDFFLLPSSSHGKRKVSFLCALCVFAVKIENAIKLHKSTHYIE